VPSAKRLPQLAVFAVCGALGAGSLAGCETTQEKAAAKQAESERILEARAKRQAQRNHGTKSRTSPADGTNSRTQNDKSARRHLEDDQPARQGQKGEG
jgi:hypothetical protein